MVKPKLPILNRAHPLARGLVGAWLMYEGNGTVTRSITGRHHGTINSFDWSQQKYGPVLYCDANGESAVADHDDLDPAQITIVARVYPIAGGAYYQIVDKGGNSGWRCRLNNTNTLSMFDRGGTNTISSSSTITDGVWTTVGFNWASTGLSIYVNGRLDNSGGSAYGAPSTSGILYLGGTAITDSDWNGYIDYILMYNRPLLPAEHHALHINPYQAFQPPTGLYAPFLTGAAPPSTSTVQLTWTDNSGGAQTFNIERSTTSAYTGFTEIADGESSPYSDTDLADDTYWYRVRGFDGTDYTDYSNPVEITVTS